MSGTELDLAGEPAPSAEAPAVRRGVRRWLTPAEAATLRGHESARVALVRSVGEESPAAPFIDVWLDTIDNPNTREAYATDLRLFVEWLRDKHDVADEVPVNLLKVTFEVCASYANAMRAMVGRYGKPLSPQTRARRISSLRVFYRFLSLRREVRINPVTDLPRPRVDPSGMTPARGAVEIAAILAAAGESGPRDLALVLLLATTALRVSELGRARVEHMSNANGRCLLEVRALKGGKVRQVPLEPIVCEALAAHHGERESGPLLAEARAGKAMTRAQVTYALQRLAASAGVKNPRAVTPHVIRTSAATYWLELGIALQKVQHKLNHSSPSITQRYHRRSQGIADDAALSATFIADLDVDAAFATLRDHAPA